MASTISFGDANSGLQAGVINGPVNAIFHAASERPETPPEPSAIIPFSRDDDFVQRGSILDRLHQACAKPDSRTALVGLGGVGKSQIAIEYAHQIRERQLDTWVFWVHASNAARYEQSFRGIADLIKLPGRKDPQNNIFQLVHDWLLSSKSGRWVIILDNLDEVSFLIAAQPTNHDNLSCNAASVSSPTASSSSSPTPLKSYLPHCPCGSILVTSRRTDVAKELVEKHNFIFVEPMSRTDATSLVQKKLGPLCTSNDVGSAELLAVALECMPLAIVQATSYISQRAPRCSLGQYLEKFEQSDKKRASLLDFEGGQLRRDWEAKNSIILTWQISFDYIRDMWPSAANLLSMMSFCDRQGIPESLLRRLNHDNVGKEEEEKEEEEEEGEEEGEEGKHLKERSNNDESPSGDDWSSSESDVSFTNEGLEKDILALRDFAFISVTEHGTTFEMHRLVQLATRTWLQGQGHEERWKREFIRCLCAELPNGQFENWAEWHALLPQAKSAATQRPKGEDSEASLAEWASILYKMAWYLEQMGRGDEGLKAAEDAMRARIKLFGRENEESLWARSMVSDIYSLQGRWSNAEKLRTEVLETRKTKLGVDHPSTLISLANLAVTYSSQGRWEEAEKLEVEVMETSKTKLGVNHPDTLISMGNLASTYSSQGRWEEAEKLKVEVMETRKTKLGLDHPDTLVSMGNLARSYADQGRWEEAEKLEVEVMETRKTKLGVNHPDTLVSIANLAATYSSQGRLEEAEKLEVEVMETRKTKLGVDHPSTLISMANLAFTKHDLGQHATAVNMMRDCLQGRIRIFGNQHPDVTISATVLTQWETDLADITSDIALLALGDLF